MYPPSLDAAAVAPYWLWQPLITSCCHCHCFLPDFAALLCVALVTPARALPDQSPFLLMPLMPLAALSFILLHVNGQGHRASVSCGGAQWQPGRSAVHVCVVCESAGLGRRLPRVKREGSWAGAGVWPAILSECGSGIKWAVGDGNKQHPLGWADCKDDGGKASEG